MTCFEMGVYTYWRDDALLLQKNKEGGGGWITEKVMWKNDWATIGMSYYSE